MRFNKLRRYREIGELRNYITIEIPTYLPNNSGGATTTWSTFQSCWAKIEPKGLRQAFMADAPEKRVSHIVTLRWMDVNNVGTPAVSLTNQMRVNWNGRFLQIHSFTDVEERERYQILDCIEGTPS
jgi:SPP1 family predicted phage head-tail adaptor